MLFANEQRELARAQSNSAKSGENARLIRDRWNELSARARSVYESRADKAKELYEAEQQLYEHELEDYLATHPGPMGARLSSGQIPPSSDGQSMKFSLYNKVVRLKPGSMTECSDYTYW